MADELVRQLLNLGADRVLSIMSELLLSHDHDSRQTAAAAFGIYKTAASPDIRFLEMAISCMEIFMDTIGGLGDANELATLSTYLYERYKQLQKLEDLEKCIVYTTVAFDEAQRRPMDYPNGAGMLSNLGAYYGSRYERTGNLQDLEAAIARSEAAVEATPEDHPDRAAMLNNLGNRFSRRYERTGNLQDLEAAIARSEAAVEAIPEDHPDRAAMLNNLGNRFSSRYERTGNLQDLEAAIARSEAAVEATPEDHPDRAGRLSNLGSSFSSRYERTGNLQDLEAAIARSEAAVEAIPEDHPDRAAMLNNLGNRFSRRYERTGNLQDLEAAIARSEAAVEATPEDHPDRAAMLNNLGNRFSRRYERTGNLQDLEAAIARSEAAVEAIPEDHPDRAAMLNNLGNRFSRRYERTGNLQDLEAAIARSEAAVEAIPEDHPDRAAMLNNLGAHFSSRYERTGNLQDLEAAIARSEAAVEAIPEDHPDRAAMLNNLGNRFSSRYERTGNLQDLEAAIARSEAAVEATPEDHPDRAGKLSNLGGCFMRYSSAVADPAKSIQAIQMSFNAKFASWSCGNGFILVRLRAAIAASNMLVFNPWVEDLSKASLLTHDAIHLMPLVTSRSLEREDQQYILGQLTGLASLAAAVSLEARQSPFKALQLLELGRSVTNGQLLDYRSDISDLMDQHPTLARKFDLLRLELDSPLPPTESSDISVDKRIQIQQATIRKRNQAAKDLDATLQEIRQQSGFENFLRPETEEHLLSAAKEGAIVVLNVTKLRSDAILVTKEKVTSVCLPKLSHNLVDKYFGSHATLEPGSENQFIRELLTWLWEAAVQPVLESLGCFQINISSTARPDSDHLPRIWWIGVGLMAKAPIHAAGKYNVKGSLRPKMSTLQYCIPSYTSTIRALLYSRSRQSQLNAPMGSGNTLIVTMPTTPGAGSLVGVNQEADEIERSLKDFSTVEILRRPSAERVLQLLPGYSIAHFACHGVSTINPADSHLMLLKQSISHDGACNEEVDRLRVKDIAAKKLPTARLAYLSACSTANSADSKLIDEVTHIVSSFHIAGFIHVIGTLWPSEDEACQNMAMEFYSSLHRTNDVAVSYRNAIIKLRASKPSQPMYWAPFIHFGA